MKLVTVMAGLGLALAPLAVGAGTVTPVVDDKQAAAIEPGGVSQTGAEGLPVLSAIPAGAVVVGGVVVLGGVAIGVVAASDDSNSATATTSTN